METSSVTRHAHLVGSIPFSSSTEVFSRLATLFPNRLRRMPDGETGVRDYFVKWQIAVFKESPFLYRDAFRNGQELERGPIILNSTGYDDAAIASYATFCKLREDGIIPHGVRFQVSLPTPVNVMAFVIDPQYQAEVEPLYTDLLLAALRRIQEFIPARDLAIQWDAAMEFGMLENIGPSSAQRISEMLAQDQQPSITDMTAAWCTPWFEPVKEGIVERFVRLSDAVDQGVEMGFHLCYGDAGHKHFIEPKDSSHLVEMANFILDLIKRDVNWIHMPVPKDRTDVEYFEPMKGLRLKERTELILGLAHPGDMQGTKHRMASAQIVIGRQFGVSSECGLGRSGREEAEGVLEVMAAVTARQY